MFSHIWISGELGSRDTVRFQSVDSCEKIATKSNRKPPDYHRRPPKACRSNTGEALLEFSIDVCDILIWGNQWRGHSDTVTTHSNTFWLPAAAVLVVPRSLFYRFQIRLHSLRRRGGWGTTNVELFGSSIDDDDESKANDFTPLGRGLFRAQFRNACEENRDGFFFFFVANRHMSVSLCRSIKGSFKTKSMAFPPRDDMWQTCGFRFRFWTPRIWFTHFRAYYQNWHWVMKDNWFRNDGGLEMVYESYHYHQMNEERGIYFQTIDSYEIKFSGYK